MRKIFIVALFLPISFVFPGYAVSGTILHLQTDKGGVDIELFDTVAPETVTNFLRYVNDGAYDGTFIHRSVPGFVLQMGGYIFDPLQGEFFGEGTSHIPTYPPVVNEFGISNMRGTIAMAKVEGDPNSATSEFFINLADNSENLDNQNGGFTVFAEVVAGMDVIDSIAEEPVCISYFIFDNGQCYGFNGDDVTSFNNTPLLNMLVDNPLFAFNFINDVTPQNLIKIISIGVNTDGDGVVDRIEDAGPNRGDGNSDNIPDSAQPNVASLPDIKGSYLTVEAASSILLQSLGFSYGLDFFAEADPASQLNGLNFTHGFLAFEASNIAAGGIVDIKIILPEGEAPLTYFKYGPTPDNPVDHLYEFKFDGETGAEFNGNVVTLHFVDGKRGDSDLIANGVIVDPGAPALRANISSAGGGGGGCTIARDGASVMKAGAWWLLLALFCLHGIRQGCRRIRQ